MRGTDEQPGSMCSYVSLEERVPADVSLACLVFAAAVVVPALVYSIFPWATAPRRGERYK
jgi:hypothetical protein